MPRRTRRLPRGDEQQVPFLRAVRRDQWREDRREEEREKEDCAENRARIPDQLVPRVAPEPAAARRLELELGNFELGYGHEAPIMSSESSG